MRQALIIGYGMVGKATAHAFGIKDHISLTEKTTQNPENFHYIFMCLPTPTKDGICDISLTRTWIKYIAEFKKDNRFIIRSTVAPGTCKALAEEFHVPIIHAPEFLTEATWREDAEWSDLLVIGADDEKYRDEIFGLFRARYKGAEYIKTDTITSETIKYAINSLYATKVIFANELYDYCQDKGINYETVKNAMYARKWIGKNHLDIFHHGGRGAGGKCLGKDLDAFANETCSELLLKVNEINKNLLLDFPKDNDKNKA